MKRKAKALLCITLFTALLCTPAAARAQETESPEVTSDAKPYIALGEDLKEDEKKKVLELMGIKEEELSFYEVVYVTNEQEHQYLDAYVPVEEIGTRALSSVKISLREEGAGVSVSTVNITYCTVGMYQNALLTAGVKDADILVAGPFELSGTAALIGTFKAYEKLTGNALDEAVVDVAMNELVVTGDLEESIDGNAEDIEAMIAELKGAVARGEIVSPEEIKAAIEEMAKDYKLKLSEEDKKKLLELLEKIKDLDLDWEEIASQTAQIAGQVKDVMEESGLMDLLKEFFKKLLELIVSWFK